MDKINRLKVVLVKKRRVAIGWQTNWVSQHVQLVNGVVIQHYQIYNT